MKKRFFLKRGLCLLFCWAGLVDSTEESAEEGKMKALCIWGLQLTFNSPCTEIKSNCGAQLHGLVLRLRFQAPLNGGNRVTRHKAWYMCYLLRRT